MGGWGGGSSALWVLPWEVRKSPLQKKGKSPLQRPQPTSSLFGAQASGQPRAGLNLGIAAHVLSLSFPREHFGGGV